MVTSKEFERIVQVKERIEEELLQKESVVGVDIRVSEKTRNPCIWIYVTKADAVSQLPKTIEGIEVEVSVTDIIRPL